MRRLILILLFPVLSLAQLEVMVNDLSLEKDFIVMGINELYDGDIHLIESTFFKNKLNVKHDPYTTGVGVNVFLVDIIYNVDGIESVKGKVTYNRNIVAMFSYNNRKTNYSRKKIIDLIVKGLINTDSL
tara:strand:- start:17224 stop:17610 length:387 start_codon:yes stop_codon:yes gene_type:complete